MAKTYLFWEPSSDNILQERDESGALVTEYTAEPRLYGNVIGQNRDDVDYQCHYDIQGSTLTVTDESQNVADTFAYTAFGEVHDRISITDVPFQYIGQKGYYVDGITGQIMARRRQYGPFNARWLTTDPLKSIVATRTRPYIYAKNSPLTFIDPNGHMPRCLGKWWRPSLDGCTYRTGDPNPNFRMPTKEERGCTPPAVADWGDWNFEDACDAHDECWQTCAKPQNECDRAYLDKMRSECNALPAGSEARNCCNLVALTYYYYVQSFGVPIYQYSQDISCAWKPCCCPLIQNCEDDEAMGCHTITGSPKVIAHETLELQRPPAGGVANPLNIWPFTLIPDACREFAPNQP